MCHWLTFPISTLFENFNPAKGSHHRLKEVSLFDAKELIIEANPQLEAHIDGEYFNQPPFSVSILPEPFKSGPPYFELTVFTDHPITRPCGLIPK